jgi:hypothetical protein
MSCLLTDYAALDSTVAGSASSSQSRTTAALQD